MAEHLLFSRRRFVAGGLAMASVVQLRSAVCRLSAEQEVGPYYVADELLRTDIVEGKPGVPLSLRIVVLDSRTCTPLRDAAVDLWHCDALGLYSGFTKQNPIGPGGPGGFGGPPPGRFPGTPPDGPRPDGPPPDGIGLPGGPPPHNHPTDQFTFLRGIQLTGEDGVVQFQSIFPGVYMGRTNHIHFKVRVGGHEGGKSYQAGHAAHTGQIFFPEELAVQLMAREPYRQHEIHRTTQAEDMIYGDQHGELSVARIDPLKVKELAADLKIRAELIAAVDPTATPADARRRGGPGPRF
jgi:protocatechuate 3,4-dioxygenase beta subunit